MVVVGLVLAAAAALVHVYIFWLESIAWTTARARRVFGTTPHEAQVTSALAYNQGFYNLFLAVLVVTGILVVAGGHLTVGATLVLAGTGCMVAASLVLVLSDASKASAARAQGLLPALGIVTLVIGLV